MCIICIFPLSFYHNTYAGDYCVSVFLNFFISQRLERFEQPQSKQHCEAFCILFKKMHCFSLVQQYENGPNPYHK